MDLILLIVSVALAALALSTATALKREHAAARQADTGPRLRELGHYELAYLAGGAYQVAETAIALLAGSGDLRVSRGGRVHQVHSSVVSREPIEEAVLGVVASRSGLPVSALRIETTRTLAMDALDRHLEGLGLIQADDALVRAGRLSARLRTLSGMAFAFVAGAVLVLIQGVSLLAALAPALLAVTGLMAAIDVRRHRRAARVTLTPSGQETLDVARRDNPRGTAEGPVAIALYGLGEVRDPDLQVELTASTGRRRRRGGGAYVVGAGGCSGAGGSSPSSGSSCGGGSSSCGGGCGGGCGGS
ncbi:TIGR04222 domain-containing membrane protein [Nonomuraea turkmeniaca]|uniref:TIGR04222 domain-containing membrane protein n=1 Tax=Nonomuraea turkmeniaca TaxID=103838 RepID=A0A5S4EXQ0_9ACTN|nr:TIGR04222 domain-containing membrane protein [Nonomuraea turkmeniaca]TMR08465.1 TIGR04222 domain-containing membrane protein [Nonomuraea turkmeniaca]